MRGIILAAGQGSRLRPLTDDRPKCLVEYRGKPIVEYTIDAMRACGITDIVVIKGYREECIQIPGIRTVLNPQFASTNMVETLFCAKHFLEGDTLISYGDIVYGPGTLAPLATSPHEFAVAVDLEWQTLWKARMEDPLSDAETLRFGEKDQIVELGKKPRSLDEIEAQYMGLIKISSLAIKKVVEYYLSLDRGASYDGRPFEQMYMTSFIQSIIDNLMPVHGVKIRGGWLEIDSPEDLQVDVKLLSLPA